MVSWNLEPRCAHLCFNSSRDMVGGTAEARDRSRDEFDLKIECDRREWSAESCWLVYGHCEGVAPSGTPVPSTNQNTCPIG